MITRSLRLLARIRNYIVDFDVENVRGEVISESGRSRWGSRGTSDGPRLALLADPSNHQTRLTMLKSAKTTKHGVFFWIWEVAYKIIFLIIMGGGRKDLILWTNGKTETDYTKNWLAADQQTSSFTGEGRGGSELCGTELSPIFGLSLALVSVMDQTPSLHHRTDTHTAIHPFSNQPSTQQLNQTNTHNQTKKFCVEHIQTANISKI